MYATTPQYAALNSDLFPLFAPHPPAPVPYMFHVRFSRPCGLWEAEAVEILLFYVAVDRDGAEEDLFDARLKDVEAGGRYDDRGMVGITGGWVEGLVSQNSGRSNHCRLYVLAQLWRSEDELQKGQRQAAATICEAISGLYMECKKHTVLLQGCDRRVR